MAGVPQVFWVKRPISFEERYLNISSVYSQTLANTLIGKEEEWQPEEKLNHWRDAGTTVLDTQSAPISMIFLSILPIFSP